MVLDLPAGAWLYVINFYGQLREGEIKALKDKYDRVIVDNAQAYFSQPQPHIDTLYTCRKFFGVPDGAVLYTDVQIKNEEFVQDESYERMQFLLGRYECGAHKFYSNFLQNENHFINEPIKKMSVLTRNLLRVLDYKKIFQKRTKNFMILNHELSKLNGLKLRNPQGDICILF